MKMRVISLSAIFICAITVCVFVDAFPIDNNGGKITLSDVYEITEDKTSDLPVDANTSRRVKRQDVIAFIRRFCPPLADFVNNIYQRAKKIVFQVIGKLLLSGNKKRPATGQEKPAVIVSLPEFPEEETTTEPVPTSESSSERGDSPSSSESSSSDSSSSSSSSESSSTEASSASSESSLPSSDNSEAETTSSAPETTSSAPETTSSAPGSTSSTERPSSVQKNSISTK